MLINIQFVHGLCKITCYVLATENGKGNQGLIIQRHGQIFSTHDIEQRQTNTLHKNTQQNKIE
jgi:hypothetical protein